MYRSISKAQNLKRTTVVFVRFLRRHNVLEPKKDELAIKSSDGKLSSIVESSVASEILDSFKPQKSAFKMRKIMFDDLSEDQRKDYKIKKMDQYYNDDLVVSVNNCPTVSDVLKFVEPQISSVRPDHLECVYDKLISLCNEARKNEHSREYIDAIRRSSSYDALLKRALFLIRELDTRCLVKQFTYLNLIGQDVNTKIVKVTLEMLKHKINDLELNEIGQCLFTFFSIPNVGLDNFFKTFRYALIQVAKLKIMKNEYDTDHIDLISAYLKIFTSFDFSTNHDAIIRLVQILLKTKVPFDYNQSIRFLTIARQLYKLPVNELSQDLISQLIKRCNLTVLETLALEPSEQKTLFYLEKLHHKTIRNFGTNPAFDHFFDHRVLSLVASSISSSFQSFDKAHVLNLLQNFSRSNCWDEGLMRMMLEEIYSDDELKYKFNLYSIFELYSKIKLPFVDLNRLVGFLFESTDMGNVQTTFRLHSLDLLIDFILFDVRNESLLNELNRKSGYQNSDSLSLLTDEKLFKLSLARIHLRMFCKFNEKLQQDLESKFDQMNIMALPLVGRRKLMKKYFKVNNRIQRNGFLSNGLYLKGAFGIYDKSADEIVPLTDYEEYFNRVDKMPLNGNQEVFTFIESSKLKGNIAQYGLNSTYQFKRILKELKINPIDVYSEDLSNFKYEDRINYLLNLASSSYQKI